MRVAGVRALGQPAAVDAGAAHATLRRIVSGKWTLLILRDLAAGPCRFSQIERSLAGISPRTLSLRLRALEDEGIVERREHVDTLPRADYHLTDRGRDLLPIVAAMRDYGERWQMDCESA